MEKGTAEQSQAATCLSHPCSDASSTHTGMAQKHHTAGHADTKGRWREVSSPPHHCLVSMQGWGTRAEPNSWRCQCPHPAMLLMAGTSKSTRGFSTGDSFHNPAATQHSPGAIGPSALNLKILPELTHTTVHFKKNEWFGKGAFNRLPQHCAALAAPPGMLSQPKAGRETQDPRPPTALHKVGPPLWNTADLRAIVTACRLYKQEPKQDGRKRFLVGTNLTRQCPMKGESKKGNRNRGQREKSVRGSVMPETVPGPHGWMPTQSLQKKKKKGYRAPKTFLIKKSVQAEVCQVILVLAVPAPPLSPRGLSLEYFSGEEQQGLQ